MRNARPGIVRFLPIATVLFAWGSAASGKSTNTLEVQVAPTAVSYLINGAVVHATPTRAGTGSYTETEKTHGIVGVRIDDHTDVHVDGFEVK